MIKKFKHMTAGLKALLRISSVADQRLDQLMFVQGQILAGQIAGRQGTSLQDFEFKVFSQFGEDGIIQKLIRHIDIPSKTFIEFGVQDFRESNCRFLMMNNNWRGMVIDGSEQNILAIRRAPSYWRHQLEAVCAFINLENISGLISQSGFGEDIGILSVDIDGVDYWILKAIQECSPRILIVEYNSLFGAERAITVPYDPEFDRTKKHFSNLYFGASLAALHHLATERGYSLIGSNSAGINAFFVRNDQLHNCPFPPLSVKEAFVTSLVRQSRAPSGELTFLTGDEQIEAIRGLPVVNVRTGLPEPL